MLPDVDDLPGLPVGSLPGCSTAPADGEPFDIFVFIQGPCVSVCPLPTLYEPVVVLCDPGAAAVSCPGDSLMRGGRALFGTAPHASVAWAQERRSSSLSIPKASGHIFADERDGSDGSYASAFSLGCDIFSPGDPLLSADADLLSTSCDDHSLLSAHCSAPCNFPPRKCFR